MDTFIDKLAQKRNAQDMILANMTAEAAKMERMQSQVKVHGELIQELHRVNLKTAENLSEIQDTLNEYMGKLEGMLGNHDRDSETKQALEELKKILEDDSRNDDTKQALEELRKILENNNRNDDTKQALDQLKDIQEERFRQSDDYLHKENVKVYRNVQAAVTEELAKQTDELKQSQKENRGSKALLPISVLILIAVLADIAIHLFSITIPL